MAGHLLRRQSRETSLKKRHLRWDLHEKEELSRGRILTLGLVPEDQNNKNAGLRALLLPVCPLPRLLVTKVSLFFIFCHPNSEEATGQIDLTDYNGTCLAEPLLEGLEDEQPLVHSVLHGHLSPRPGASRPRHEAIVSVKNREGHIQ